MTKKKFPFRNLEEGLNNDQSIRQREKEMMEFFEQLEPLGDIFVGSWGYYIRFDPEAESFYFNHKKKEIGISPKLIEKMNLTTPEKLFAFCHELGHLAQLFQSPDDYLESFEIPKRKAKEEKKEVQEFTKEAWHYFFNAFFDIHVNSIVRRRIASFQKDQKHEHLPENLYKNKLFAKKDFTELPHSEQLVSFLLKKAMAPDSEAKISKEVGEVINQPVKLMGFEYSSALDFVRQEIYNPDHNCEDLMFYLSQRLMPLFEKLLKEDIENNRIQMPKKIGINLDEDLTEGVIKDIVEGHKEARKPSSEKMKEAKKREFKEWASGKGFSETEIERMMEIKEATKEIHHDLRDLWESFIQRSVEFQEAKKTGFKKGAGIAGERLAPEMPTLLTNPSEAEIFYRYISEEKKESIKPKKINLVLIVDLSGSMDRGKREAVQEVTYAINKSLIDWYRDIKNAVSDYGETSPINIDLDVIGFGSSLKEEMMAKTPQEKQERRKIDEPPEKDVEKELWQAIFDIQRIDLGGTQDALALNLAEKSITPEVERQLEKEEEITVVLEITDGETTTEKESKKLVKSLNERKGVFARAIQIPGPIYSEDKPKTEEERMGPPKVLAPTGTFKEVWGNYGRRLENLAALKETVYQILKDALEEYRTL